MDRAVRKIFGVYPGEGRNILRFCLMAFTWAFGIQTLETLSDGLFLDQIGASHLPQMYLIASLGFFIVATLIVRSLRTVGPYRILQASLLTGVCVAAIGAIWIGNAPSDTFWYALKVASRMLFVVLTAAIWTFLDQYHDIQDAKRFYSLYASAFFLGCTLSGLSIGLLLDSIGYPGLFALISVALLGAALQAGHITQVIHTMPDDISEGIHSGDRHTFSQTIKLILTSPYTLFLLALSLLIQLLLVVSEFSYMETFERVIGAQDPGAVSEFLGKCRAMISFSNIIVGFLFYGRFVRRFGVHNAILITPLCFLFTYSQWVSYDTLLIAILGLITVDGILFTIEDNSFNLLTKAVPNKLRSKARLINDSFFEPAGTLFCSLILFALPFGAKWVGLALSALALTAALILRSLYPKALILNLKDSSLHFERTLPEWIAQISRRDARETQRTLEKTLHNPQEEIALLASEGLLSLRNLEPVLRAADRFGTLTRIQLLQKLEGTPYVADPSVLEAVSRWADEGSSPELEKWANYYLAKQGLHHPDQVEEELDHPDLLRRSAAILTLQRSLANPTLDYAGLNRTIAAKRIELMLKSDRIDEIATALDILAEAPERALPFLSHEAIVVKRAAARCIARLATSTHARYTPRLIEELTAARDNAFRLSLLEALGKMADTTCLRDLLEASTRFRPNERRKAEAIMVAIGLKTVPLLLTLIRDLSLPNRGRILAGRVLSRLALPQLTANLPEIVGAEIDRAYFYLYTAHKIAKPFPHELLQHTLLTGYHSSLDFVLYLLGASGSLEDPELLVHALHSRSDKIRSHAVESLEKTCDPKLFRLLLPLIDELPMEEKLNIAAAAHPDLPTLTVPELLNRLDRSPSLLDQIVATRLKAELELPNWRAELRERLKTCTDTFHQYAYELLET